MKRVVNTSDYLKETTLRRTCYRKGTQLAVACEKKAEGEPFFLLYPSGSLIVGNTVFTQESKLLVSVVCFAELVYELFGQSNMNT